MTLTPSTACSSACTIAADAHVTGSSHAFATSEPSLQQRSAREFTISPVAINTVSVYSTLRGSLGTCISHVEWMRQERPDEGCFRRPSRFAVCRNTHCEDACQQASPFLPAGAATRDPPGV